MANEVECKARLLGGVLVCLLMGACLPAATQPMQGKRGMPERPPDLSVIVVAERPSGDIDPAGGLGFTCTKEQDDVHIALTMQSYRLRNSNIYSCPLAGVFLQFDTDVEGSIGTTWFRPQAWNVTQTWVTTQFEAECSPGFVRFVRTLNPPAQILYRAISAKYLYATISDRDSVSEGPDTTQDSPLMTFNLEAVRSELIDLYNDCRKPHPVTPEGGRGRQVLPSRR